MVKSQNKEKKFCEKVQSSFVFRKLKIIMKQQKSSKVFFYFEIVSNIYRSK